MPPALAQREISMNPRTREGIPSGAAFEPVVIFLVEANDGTRHHCVPFGPAKFSTANVPARSQIAAFDWPDGPAWPGRGLGNAYASVRPRNTCFEPALAGMRLTPISNHPRGAVPAQKAIFQPSSMVCVQ